MRSPRLGTGGCVTSESGSSAGDGSPSWASLLLGGAREATVFETVYCFSSPLRMPRARQDGPAAVAEHFWFNFPIFQWFYCLELGSPLYLGAT